MTLEKQNVSARTTTIRYVNLLKHVQPGAHYVRPMSDLVPQQKVQCCSHRRLLNLTGFFSSFADAGAEPATGVVAITFWVLDYGPDQGKSGASLLRQVQRGAFNSSLQQHDGGFSSLSDEIRLEFA